MSPTKNFEALLIYVPLKPTFHSSADVVYLINVFNLLRVLSDPTAEVKRGEELGEAGQFSCLQVVGSREPRHSEAPLRLWSERSSLHETRWKSHIHHGGFALIHKVFIINLSTCVYMCVCEHIKNCPYGALTLFSDHHPI